MINSRREVGRNCIPIASGVVALAFQTNFKTESLHTSSVVVPPMPASPVNLKWKSLETSVAMKKLHEVSAASCHADAKKDTTDRLGFDYRERKLQENKNKRMPQSEY
jgi:hypothetical protein